MINSVNVAPQTVPVNQNVLFNVDRVRTKSCKCGGWLSHDLGSGLFSINQCGFYEIEYNANISSETVGAASLVLRRNGENIGGTNAIYTVADANALGNVKASTIIQVPCGGNATISLGNSSDLPLTVQDANIIIKKIA